MAAWQHESFKSFYHQTGWVLLRGSQSSSPPQPSLERNRLTQEEFRQRFDSVFEGCGLDRMEDITSNESVAWVEANAALEKTIQLATVAGATYRTEEVAGICFEDGKCNGVDLKNGEQLRGFGVVLAMGPWTGPFIARHPHLQVPAGLFTNAGVCTATVTLDEAEVSKYSRMPILVCRTHGIFAS